MFHNTEDKVIIHVPYADKDNAKQHGAFYDGDLKSWCIPGGQKNKNYDYLIKTYSQPIKKGIKIYLDVPFDDKDDAKEKGAWYDAEKKAWFTWDDNPNKKQLVKLYKKV